MLPRVRSLLLPIVLLWSVLSASVLADYGPKDSVVVLTDKNFEKEVLQSPDYWLVEFYAPWCGHCKNLEPEYKAAAKKLKKNARLGAVDATVHQALAQKYQIKGFPTIKEFGAKKKRPRDYQGGRTSRDIVQYVKNSAEAKKLGVGGANVPTLEYAKVHTFLNKKDLPSAIFFGTPKKGKKGGAGKTPKWLGAVAESFTEGTKKKKKQLTVQLAFVPGNDDKIASHLGLTEDQLPAVIYVYPESQKYVVSDVSPLNEAAAKKFIGDALANTETAQNDETLPSVPQFPSPEVAKKKPAVALKELDAKSIRKCVAKRGQMCVVVAKEDSELVRSLAKKYRRDPFTFLSTKSGTQAFKALSEFVEEGAKENPEVIVVKPGRKVKYSALSGTNDENVISEFLDKLLDGSSSFSEPSGDLEALEAALSVGSEAAATHEEL
ncbi:protein disulfide isomerase (PDI) protein [Phytophthora boehmeriae]|uniref:protein disulfide-isomerase n=1 Tax=Phytophthora boehmeriae TaxID=109152 RepID=A0A8T1X114_9STRA|nr:protein disulfide isomerase (PDI) protein [Phytophthora boehmeriae]